MRRLKQRIIEKKVKEELKMKNGRIEVNTISCDGCGICATVCPHSAISLKAITKEEVAAMPFKGRLKVRFKGNEKAYISDYDQCTTCGKCMKHCHEFAIHKVAVN